MKTKLLSLFIVIFMSATAFSQESIIQDIDEPMLQKYIHLAMANYPLKKASDATLERSKTQVSIATLSLFDIFNAGYFYSPQKNEGLILVPGASTSANTSLVMRGFQFGVNVNLGNLLSKPGMIKAAKADYKIARAQSEDYSRILANNVKLAYYDYLAAKKQLELSILAAKDLRSILANAQAQFQNGTITIDVYTAAKNASISADTGALTAEVAYLKAKNNLEDLIGEKLEKVR
ncbi:TolC family protein [Niabella aquatica]